MKIARLPKNKFTVIDETIAKFDDMRICFFCKHICIISAVACQCDNQKVSCLKHHKLMCNCIIHKKMMLGK